MHAPAPHLLRHASARRTRASGTPKKRAIRGRERGHALLLPVPLLIIQRMRGADKGGACKPWGEGTPQAVLPKGRGRDV